MVLRVAIILITSCLVATNLWAIESNDSTFTDAQVEQLASEIYVSVLSPFCPGRALSDCPSNAASELKRDIRSRLKSGQSKEQVLEHLYTLYGDEIRAAPEFASFGLVAWLAPLAFLIVGLIGIALWLGRNKTNSVSASHNSDFNELDF